eukprot:6753122-Ditylum_brightwellii.AAC.1
MNTIDVMLKKDQGSPKTHHIHIIVIIEADMYMNMKVIWVRWLVCQAKKLSFISKVQLENRKGMTASDALLLKVANHGFDEI